MTPTEKQAKLDELVRVYKQRSAAAKVAHARAKVAMARVHDKLPLSLEQSQALHAWGAAEEARAIAGELLNEALFGQDLTAGKQEVSHE